MRASPLMGLFGDNMSTNYGEGKRVFIRLQNEIIQHVCDMSLFAFGYCLNPGDSVCDSEGIVLIRQGGIDYGHPSQYLLADPPRQFRRTFGYIPDLGSKATQHT